MMDFETLQAKERLLSGAATQQDRDRVLYFLAESRWTPTQLEAHIKTVHNNLCQNCPERQHQKIPLDWNGIVKAVIYAISILGTAIVALIKLIPHH